MHDILPSMDPALSMTLGQAHLYLPFIEGRNPAPTDLKLTTFGTITFISGNAYEVDYNGKVLWQAPNNGYVSHMDHEILHHEFTRCRTGTTWCWAMSSWTAAGGRQHPAHSGQPGQMSTPNCARDSGTICFIALADRYVQGAVCPQRQFTNSLLSTM